MRCTQIACTADPLAIADPALDSVAAAPDPPPFEEPGPVEDALAGLTVAFAVLSKAIACSAIVGVEPLVGVWSSVAVGAAAPAFGMRPGVMAGAAAVCAVPLGVFVSANGPELLPFVVLLAAAIEGVVGALRLTRYIDLVSPSVLAGFLNALGVLLFTSQLKVFAAAPDEYAAIGVAATSALIAQLLPRVTSVAVCARDLHLQAYSTEAHTEPETQRLRAYDLLGPTRCQEVSPHHSLYAGCSLEGLATELQVSGEGTFTCVSGGHEPEAEGPGLSADVEARRCACSLHILDSELIKASEPRKRAPLASDRASRHRHDSVRAHLDGRGRAGSAQAEQCEEPLHGR